MAMKLKKEMIKWTTDVETLALQRTRETQENAAEKIVVVAGTAVIKVESLEKEDTLRTKASTLAIDKTQVKEDILKISTTLQEILKKEDTLVLVTIEKISR